MKDQHNTDIEKLEQQLADLNPNPLSENILSRMEQAMASWELHLPVEDKIVPFEPASSVNSKKKSLFPILSAAAAIALTAAVGAVFMTDSADPINGGSYAAMASVETEIPAATAEAISPHFSHHLTNASNEGITYASDDTPYKVFKIEYTKDVIKKDANGKTIITKEPVVEVILLPVEAH